MQRLFRLLGPSRSFRSLLIAALSDDLAKGVATFLLPVATVSLTTSPVHVAAVTVCLTLPWLLVGPLAGLIVDRADRRRLLIGAELVRFAALCLLTAFLAGGWATLPLLYATALVLGITETLIEPALVAIVPGVTPRGWLEHANARIVGGRTVMDSVAQPVSGALASLGLAIAAAAAAFGFALAGGGYRQMRGRFDQRRADHRAPTRPARNRLREIRGDIAGGLGAILAFEPLRTITMASAVINGCWAAWWSVWALYALAPGPVGLSPFGLGLLLTAGTASTFAGAALALPVQRRFGRRWAIGINILGNAALFGITAMTSAVWPIALALLLGDFGAPGWAVAANTWQQRNVREDLRGRVASAYRVLGFGAKAIGAAAGGVIAAQVGIPALYALCAVVTLATLVPFFRYVTEAAMGESFRRGHTNDTIGPQ